MMVTVATLMLAAGSSFTVAAAIPETPVVALCAPVPESAGPPVYYAIDLVPTGRVAGTRNAPGVAEVAFPDTPFGIQLGLDGQYAYDLSIDAGRLPDPRRGVYAVWLSTARLDEIRLVGTLDASRRITARVPWNKFLVVVTLEASAEAIGDGWAGPIVLRGMSRSGRMHTMAGHGPYQAEPCAVYGY